MSEAEVTIYYDNIIKAIGNQFADIWYALQNSDEQGIKDLIKNIQNIEISDEQSFVKKRQNKSLIQSTLYIAVRFSSGGINFASSVSPISLYCVGTANKVKPAQMLLSVFASTWTTKNLAQGLTDAEDKNLEIKDVLQVWNTPEIITNFNEIDSDFRNLFRLTGNIVIGPKAVRLGELTYFYEVEAQEEKTGSQSVSLWASDLNNRVLNKEVPIEGVDQRDWDSVVVNSFEATDDFNTLNVTFIKERGVFNIRGVAASDYIDGTVEINYTYVRTFQQEKSEKVNVMAFQDNYTANLDPQPFGNTFGFAKSEVNFSTYVFTISTYMLNNHLTAALLAVRGFRNVNGGLISSDFSPNQKMKIKLDFINGFSNIGDGIDDFFGHFKIVGSQIGQEIAGIPSLSISFTR